MDNILLEYENHLYKNTTKTDNTVKSYIYDIKNFHRFIKDKDISQDLINIKKVNILSYILYLQNKNRSSSTLARILSSLRFFYEYCYSKKLIDNNPCQRIKTPKLNNKRCDYLNKEEIIRLIEKPNLDNYYGLRDRAMMELMYATGIKVSEIVDLKLRDYKETGPYIIIENNRVLPIGKTANDFLILYLEENRAKLDKEENSEYIFLNKSGNKLSRQGFWKKIKKYAKEVNIKKNITPQIIRNTFAFHLINNGASLQAVSKMLGHNSIHTTQQYIKNYDVKILDEFNKNHPRA